MSSAAYIERINEERRSLRGQKNAANSEWTDERIELLKKLWGDGLSCSQIAAQLGGGATRNSVIGKVSRLKLPPRLVSHPKANRAKRLPGAVPTRRYRNPPPRHANDAPRPPREIVDMSPMPDAPPPLGLSLLELTPSTCKWPIGDPQQSGFAFCGHSSIEGKPYCAHHSRRAYCARVQ